MSYVFVRHLFLVQYKKAKAEWIRDISGVGFYHQHPHQKKKNIFDLLEKFSFFHLALHVLTNRSDNN